MEEITKETLRPLVQEIIREESEKQRELLKQLFQDSKFVDELTKFCLTTSSI
jgi:hypothetical protein